MTILSFMCWPKHSNRWKLVVKMETQQSYFPFRMISFFSYKCLFQLAYAELPFLYNCLFSLHTFIQMMWPSFFFFGITRKIQRLENIITNYNLFSPFLTLLDSENKNLWQLCTLHYCVCWIRFINFYYSGQS